jgi:predicted AAA+ superfamily ATPase
VPNYIFIDEIQDIAEFEKALRSLLLDQNNDLYITGSNANLLSGELATYLSGRYAT